MVINTCYNFGTDRQKLFPHAFFCNDCDKWVARDVLCCRLNEIPLDISALQSTVQWTSQRGSKKVKTGACAYLHHNQKSRFILK